MFMRQNQVFSNKAYVPLHEGALLDQVPSSWQRVDLDPCKVKPWLHEKSRTLSAVLGPTDTAPFTGAERT